MERTVAVGRSRLGIAADGWLSWQASTSSPRQSSRWMPPTTGQFAMRVNDQAAHL